MPSQVYWKRYKRIGLFHVSINPILGIGVRAGGTRTIPHVRNTFPNNLLLLIRRRFFSGCHLFIPLFDPAYDTYEGLKERTPFCFDAILAVASKIRSGNGMSFYFIAISVSYMPQVHQRQPSTNVSKKRKASLARHCLAQLYEKRQCKVCLSLLVIGYCLIKYSNASTLGMEHKRVVT